MYKHKCEASKEAAYPKGITITARVLANLKPIDDGGRVFWVEDFHNDMFPDDTRGVDFYCLDCDEPFGGVISGLDLTTIEDMLQNDDFTEVEWEDD